MSEHKLLAKITDTHLGWEDHGIFTAWLTVDYERGGSQGIGTHCLGSEKHGYEPVGSYIAGVLGAVGVEKWEDLAGKMVYVLADREIGVGSSAIIGLEGLSFRRSAKRFVFEDWRASVAELIA